MKVHFMIYSFEIKIINSEDKFVIVVDLNKNESGKKLSGPIQFRSRPKDKWPNSADSTINEWRSGSLGPLFIPACQKLTATNDRKERL